LLSSFFDKQAITLITQPKDVVGRVDTFEQQAPDHKVNRHGGLPVMAEMTGIGLHKVVTLNAASP